MKVLSLLLAAALATSSAWAIAKDEADPGQDIGDDKGLVASAIGSAFANRIVGLWSVNVSVGPCGGPASLNFVALNTFHAGGTLSDSNSVSSSLRAPGHGIWRYLGRGMYESRTQFYRFLPTGAYDGVQDIFNTSELDSRGDRYETLVRARVLNVDGSVRVELCGTGIGTRVKID